jgi:hypothetical protein
MPPTSAPGVVARCCGRINRFETPADGQIAASRDRSLVTNGAIGISRFPQPSCGKLRWDLARLRTGIGAESEVGQRFWARWASIPTDLRVEFGTLEDGTANNQVACNHDGEDALGFQFDGRWGIQ